MKWIKHFESVTWKQLQSHNDYCLLLCDSHDSYISTDFVNFCIHHYIDLILLSPHLSHLLQSLNVKVFAPLKYTISKQISHFIHSGIRRIQKVEWVEQFIIVREQEITKENVLAEWRGVSLFLENMHSILSQLTDYRDPTVSKIPSQKPTTYSPFSSTVLSLIPPLPT